MKLSEWAKLNGIGYRTAWNWFKDGKLPVKSSKTSTGTILVHLEPTTDNESLDIQIDLCEKLLMSLKSSI
jgi:predicted site-specific integrase-resolvase